MPIGFFQTLNMVLGQATIAICRSLDIDEDEAVARTRAYLEKNSAAYYSDEPKLAYHDPLCRLAYLYSYVCAHANLIDSAFRRSRKLSDFLWNKIDQDETINVCSLGGGPGSELLGLVKAMGSFLDPGKQVYIDFALIDNVREWDETWQALLRGIEETFSVTYGKSQRNWPVIVQRSFLPLNLTRLKDFRHLPTRFQDVELFILNHTVSELLGRKAKFSRVFSHIASMAPQGAYFLIIDRNQLEIRELAGEVADNAGLQRMSFREEQTNMDSDEQAADLGLWYNRMGWLPKLTWNAFFLLARKPTDEDV